MNAVKYTFDDFVKVVKELNVFFSERNNEEKKIISRKEKETLDAEKTTDNFVAQTIQNNVKQFSDYRAQIMGVKQQIDGLKLTFDYRNKTTPTAPQTFEKCLSLIKSKSEVLKSNCEALNLHDFEKTRFSYSFDGEKATINGQEYDASAFPKTDIQSFDTDSDYKRLVIDTCVTIDELVVCLDAAINYLNGSNYKKNLEARAKKVSNAHLAEFMNDADEQISNNYASASDYYLKECLPVLQANKENLKDHQTMDTLSIPYEFNYKINIGAAKIPVEEYAQFKEYIKNIDTQKLISKSMSFPFYLDLTTKGNVLINTPSIDENIVDFVHQLILQFVSSVPYKKMHLALVDVDDSDDFDFMFEYNKEYLRKNGLLVNGGPAVDESSFKEIVNALNSKINIIKGDKLSPNDCNNVFEYNEVSPQNTQELYLFVFVNCPKLLDKELTNKLITLVNNSSMCGIYSIIVNNVNDRSSFDDYYSSDDHRDFINRVSQKSVVFDYQGSNGVFTHQGRDFAPNYCFKRDSIKQFFNQVQEGFANEKDRNVIYLKDLVKGYNATKPCYEEFKVPIGKKAGETAYFRLNGTDSGMASAIIAGGTGSGKSSLLHSIILSGAYTYSPNELEYYLIDFKQGNEFNSYLDKENGIYIPHVSFVSSNNVLEDAYDLLRKIADEDSKRREFFKKAGGASDLKAYQESPMVKSGKLPSFKRIVVVIDEYQKFLDESNTNAIFLSRKCMDLLTKLLQQIRNVGISIILASQNIKLDHDAFEQIYNRYLLDSSVLDLQKAFNNYNAETMLLDLKKEKGLVYKTEDQGATKDLIKFAYSGKTNESLQKELTAMINAKYPGIKKDIIVSGDATPLPIADKFDLGIFKEEISDENRNNVNCYFGVSALSGDPIKISYNYLDFCNYVIVGQFSQVRNIEASLGLSFILSCRQHGMNSDRPFVYYLDLNAIKAAKENPSPFLKYEKELNGLVKYSYHNDCYEVIDAIYEEYLERKKRTESSTLLETQVPLLVIVNSFSEVRNNDPLLSSGNAFSQSMNDDLTTQEPVSEEAFKEFMSDTGGKFAGAEQSPEEKLKVLYKSGCLYSIYVVLQDMRISQLNGDDSFIDATRVICCDIKETENCRISDSGETYSLKAMNPQYAVLYPDVSKVRPFIFQYDSNEKAFISKFKEELK